MWSYVCFRRSVVGSERFSSNLGVQEVLRDRNILRFRRELVAGFMRARLSTLRERPQSLLPGYRHGLGSREDTPPRRNGGSQKHQIFKRQLEEHQENLPTTTKL